MNFTTEITFNSAQTAGAKYDAVCKELFLNKEIIAPILKEVIPEYKDCSIEEIISYINPGSITSDPVDDVSVLISPEQSEMNSISEKLIRYDTRFKALNPKLSNSEMCFYLHIDLEVQNYYKPSPFYPIIKRAVYYAAREISSQLSILTDTTDYNSLEKAYSIWICNERIPKEIQNTVTSYSLKKDDIIGISDEPAADYDLMQVIIIRRGNEDGTEKIFNYLTGIFTSNKDIISKYIDFESNNKIKEAVEHMSGMGMSIYEKAEARGIEIGMCRGIEQGIQKGLQKGIQKGMQQGMQEGIQKGMQEGIQKGMQEGIQKGMQEGMQKGELQEKRNNVTALLKSGLSPEFISSALNISLSEIAYISEEQKS